MSQTQGDDKINKYGVLPNLSETVGAGKSQSPQRLAKVDEGHYSKSREGVVKLHPKVQEPFQN